MSNLYKRIELVDGEPVLFVGVHILRWNFDVWGEPGFACVEAKKEEIDEEAGVTELRQQLATVTEQRNALAAQEAKPAPEASEPTSKTNVEPSASLYLYHITYGEHAEIKEVHLATKPEVCAEAVRLGLLDTERQKLAEAFLHAADKDSRADLLAMLKYLEVQERKHHWPWLMKLRSMIIALQPVKKGEG